MKDCPIFISTCDDFSDLWQPFFDLFKKYWKEYDGIIYLNTEEKTFEFKGLNIVCTQVGKLPFGKRLREGLNKVDAKNILFIMEECLFMGNIDNQIIKLYYDFFVNNQLDSLNLAQQDFRDTISLNHENLRLIIPPSKHMLTLQIAFWNKDTLYNMVLPNESPWMVEKYGTIRANIECLRIAYSTVNAIPYLYSGALHGGKWVEAMVIFLNNIDYQIDFTKRGLYENKTPTLFYRIKKRINNFGTYKSRIDLFNKRKLNKQYYFPET